MKKLTVLFLTLALCGTMLAGCGSSKSDSAAETDTTVPDSASSQFFIVHEDSTFLDGQYAAFGHVTDGMDVVDAICENTPVQDNNGTVKAADQPVITSVTVID